MSNLRIIFQNSLAITLLINFLTLILLSGCYTVRFYHDTDLLREKHDGEVYITSVIFSDTQISGPSKIRSVCPSGASMVEIEQTITDGLKYYLSLGMSSSQTVRIWCKRRNRNYD